MVPVRAIPTVNCIWKLSLIGISKQRSLGQSRRVWNMKVPGPATVWPTNITLGWVASHSMVRFNSSKYFNWVVVVILEFNQFAKAGMRIAVGIFKINYFIFEFCPLKPG